MTDRRILQRNPDFVHRKVGDEEVLVPVRRVGADLSSLYLLNPVASAIWGMLERPCTEEDLSGMMVTEFEVERSVAEADLARFLSELHSIGALIEREER